MFKTIKLAQIEVVKPSELNVGDYILQVNWKRRIVKINLLNKFIVVSNPINDTTESLPIYLNYYKIISCEEVEENEIS